MDPVGRSWAVLVGGSGRDPRLKVCVRGPRTSDGCPACYADGGFGWVSVSGQLEGGYPHLACSSNNYQTSCRLIGVSIGDFSVTPKHSPVP